MLLASILILLAGIHVYWACGGRWAADTVIPRAESGLKLMEPGKAATLTVVFLLLVAAWISIGIAIQPMIRMWLMRAMAAVFAIRAIGDFHYVGFFKTQRASLFAHWDTRLYSPLCVVMSALALMR